MTPCPVHGPDYGHNGDHLVRRIRDGQRCARATRSDYPLIAKCECGAVVFCADGTAEWTDDRRAIAEFRS